MSVLAAAAVASLINVTAENLGYGGVMLGATRASVERTLGHAVPPIKQAYPYPFCGSYESITYIAGHRVKIQWSDRMPDSTVEVVEVTLPRPIREVPSGVVALTESKEPKAAGFFPLRSEKVMLVTYEGDRREPASLAVALVRCMD